jgi:hypothetical protein
MYQDLVEHLPAILALLGLSVSVIGYLIIGAFNDMRSSIKELRSDFKAFLSNVVTRPECDQKHDSLITMFTAMMNCRNCGRKESE